MMTADDVEVRIGVRAGAQGDLGPPPPSILTMLQGALSQMNTAVLLWDEQWRLVYVNEVGTTMFEVQHPDPIGRTIWELNPNWESTPFSATAQRAIREKHVSSDRRFSVRLGRWFEMVAYPTVEGLVIYMQDVTIEETAQQDLAESVKRFRAQAALLDAARDAIFVRDLDEKIVYWNQGAERLYGWASQEAIGQTSRGLLYRDPSVFDETHAEMTRVGYWEGELEHVTSDGRTLTVDCRWQVLVDDDARPTGVMCVNSDITEYKLEQAKWYREQRMESLGMLAGGIAHDLNNVFTPMLLTSQLLVEDEPDDERRELLLSMQSSVERGADMIRQVVSFARGEEVRRSAFDLHDLLGQVRSLARSVLAPAIRLTVAAPRDLWNVAGDSTQILQVLMNLVTNARDAMAGEGDLTIRASNLSADLRSDADAEGPAGPGIVVVEVHDTGAGMSPETLDRLFEPFFTTKPLGSGTGLGLSTSLAIARGHGGDLEVDSEEGRGTTFRLTLPATGSGISSSADLIDPLPEKMRGRGEQVLIVDDENTIRGIVQQALEKDGYRTVLAASGIEAIEVLRNEGSAVDLVFTDMMMPGMDGAATAAYLATHHPGIPVVAASGLDDNGMLAHASNPSVTSFLAKPFSKTELLDAVDDALHADEVTTTSGS